MIVLSPPFSSDDDRNIKQILLEGEGTIVYPTETFYALGCAANSSKAIERVYQLKHRKKDFPLLILIDSWEMFRDYFVEISATQKKLLQKYWPGPLTAVLKSRNNLSSLLNEKSPYIGVRMTSSVMARDLIKILAAPLVGTSANRSAAAEMSVLSDVRAVFKNEIDIYIDGGKTPGGQPSTVVDMKDSRNFKVIRDGAVGLLGDI